MLLDILVIVCVVYSFLYLAVTTAVALGSVRIGGSEEPDELPRVSVVVCARNEEAAIGECMESLAAQDYPQDRLEIICVDDESEDGTREILDGIEEKYPFVKILSTENVPRDIPGKQRPLSYGIDHATGEFVCVTDADCTHSRGWIKAHIAAYNDKVGMAGSITTVGRMYKGLFARLQASELSSKLAVAMGAAGLGRPVTLMGNNLSFRKEAYDAFGGLKKIKPHIVEDMAMMNAIVERTDYKIGWVGHPDGVVSTKPETTFNDLLNQRQRWITELTRLSINGKVLMTVEILMATTFFVSLFLIPWNPAPAIISGMIWLSGYIFILSAAPGARFMDYLMIPGFILFQLTYSIPLGYRMLLGNKTVVWKGRVYHK